MEATRSEKDSENESKKFLDKLLQFHKKNGTTFRRVPTLGGRELDLYHLYKKVQSLGGYEVVSNNRMWGEVARSFNLPPSVTSASYAIRQHYAKLLERFEVFEKDPSYIHTSTITPHPLISSSLLSSTGPQLHTPVTSHSWKNFVTPPTSSSLPPTATPTLGAPHKERLLKEDGRDRLTRSLISGYPNEVDLAFNVLTIMSHKEPSTLQITEYPHLLDLILAHVAVFPSENGDLGLETLYHQCWYPDSQTDYLEFWDVSVPEWVYAAVYSNLLDTSPHLHNGLFASRREESEWSIEGYRVSQVANILNNLSSDSKSGGFLSSHTGVLRFLLLACNCCLPDICSTAMDALISLAPYLLIIPSPPSPLGVYSMSPSEFLFHSVLYSVLSCDRMISIKALNVLSLISWDAPNEVFLEQIRKEVWQHLFQLLLLPDIQLVLLSLDTLYQFTCHGSPHAASALLQVHRWCEILVSLLTLDVKDFGKEALEKVQLTRITHTTSNPSTIKPHPLLSSNKSTIATVSSGKSKIGVTVLNPSSSSLNLGSKSVSSQTVKIGNCLIPVMPGTTPLSKGKNSSVKTNKGPTVLTIQQIQSLLAKHIQAATPPPATPTTTSANRGESSGTVNGNISSSISGIAEELSSDCVKPVSNLLRSYLAKSGPTTASSTLSLNPGTTPTLNSSPITTPLLNSGTTPTLGSNPITTTLLNTSTTPTLNLGTTPSLNFDTITTPLLNLGTTPSLNFNSITIPPVTSSPLNPVPFTASPLNSTPITASPLNSVPKTTSILNSVPITTSPLNSTPITTSPLNSVPKTTSILNSVPITTSPLNSTPITTSPLNSVSISTLSVSTPSSTVNPSQDTLASPSLINATPPATSNASILTSSHKTSAPSNLPCSLSPQVPSQTSKAETFAIQWLKGCYEAVSGSYVSQLEIYSYYLLATTKTGHLSPLSNTDFNSLVRRVFPDALSTRVTVGNQIVYMIAGLAKKRSPTFPTVTQSTVSQGDTLTRFTPGTSHAGGVVTQQTIRDTRGPLSSAAMPTNGHSGITSLRTDYSTQSPLAISSKASSGAAKERKVSDTSTNKVMNGLDYDSETEDELSKAKRMKLIGDELEDVMSKIGPVGQDSHLSTNLGRTLSNDIIVKQNLTAKLERLVAKNHQLIRQSPVERTPSPSLTSSPTESRRMSPGPPGDTLSACTENSVERLSVSPAPSETSSCTGLTGAAGQIRAGVNMKTCLWNNCNSLHADSSSLESHLFRVHLPSFPVTCQWTGCTNKAKRNKPSLMAHLQAHHCGLSTGFSLPDVPRTLARLKAVHLLEHEAESPLTKAVRLTSALVLRNVSQVLPEARKRLKAFEHMLCQIALSESVGSSTVAQCLHYLQTQPS